MNLAKFRKSAGLTQQQLAERVGVSRQQIQKWECGERTPKLKNIIKLAAALDLPLEELIREYQ